MPPRISRDEHDRRAAAAGIVWIETPASNSTKTPARCLTCDWEWDVLPSSIQQGHGCPSCAGKVVQPGEWDQRARLCGYQWLEPKISDANIPIHARCLTCAHEWRARPAHALRGVGCPRCGVAAVAEKLRAPKAVRDEQAAAIGAEWLEPVMSAGTKARIRCLACGTEWLAIPNEVKAGTGCAACSRRAGGSTFRVPDAELQERAASANVEWLSPPRSNDSPTPARCITCGHHWSPRPAYLASGTGCPRCGERRAGDKMLASTIARQHEAAAVGIEYLEKPVGAHFPVAVRCLADHCGHRWTARPGNIAKGHGCPACSPRGFAPALPALVYLLRHEQGTLMKVGVTEARTDTRLRLHGRRGWERIATWPVPFGRDALAIEKAVVGWWRAAGANPCTREDVPDGQGWTEAVHITAAADEPRTIAYIEELVAEVGGGAV